MRKEYTSPEINVVNINPSNRICVSAGFGKGYTPIMHVRRRGRFIDDEDVQMIDE